MDIMIVDDEPEVAEVLAKSLNRQGHHTTVVHSGEEALRLLQASSPDALFLDLAAAVKKLVGVPIIAVGRLGDPAIATEAVAAGKADFIALGRALIAEPRWVEKLTRAEPIRRCLACNTCINEMRGGAAIGCVVNAAAGRERASRCSRPSSQGDVATRRT